MSKNQEMGYAKKIAGFKTIVSVVESYGAAYNPPLESIKLPNLQKVAGDASLALETLNSQLALQKDAIQHRNLAFVPLPKLTTRLLAFAKATGISAQQIEGLQNQNRRIQGRRAKAIKDEVADETGKMPVHISTAQMSYDGVLDNFDKFVKQVQTIPEFQPNEAELQVAQLQALYADLKAKNDAVIKVNTDIFNSRVARNEIMDKEKEGLHDLSLSVKNYVKAVYGTTDPKYRVISKISIKKN
jgi:hypothetical protein